MIGFVAMGLTGLLNEDAGINGEESGTIWLCQIVVVMGKRACEGNSRWRDRGDGVTAVENPLAVLL